MPVKVFDDLKIRSFPFPPLLAAPCSGPSGEGVHVQAVGEVDGHADARHAPLRLTPGVQGRRKDARRTRVDTATSSWIILVMWMASISDPFPAWHQAIVLIPQTPDTSTPEEGWHFGSEVRSGPSPEMRSPRAVRRSTTFDAFGLTFWSGPDGPGPTMV